MSILKNIIVVSNRFGDLTIVQDDTIDPKKIYWIDAKGEVHQFTNRADILDWVDVHKEQKG